MGYCRQKLPQCFFISYFRRRGGFPEVESMGSNPVYNAMKILHRLH